MRAELEGDSEAVGSVCGGRQEDSMFSVLFKASLLAGFSSLVAGFSPKMCPVFSQRYPSDEATSHT